jgi:hypothetical protein
MNADDTHEDYLNDTERITYNILNPKDVKHYFEKPSKENNYSFNKDLEVVKVHYYSHYPFNTLSLFYSLHQVNMLTNSYAQENNIKFDYVIRLRSDMVFNMQINLTEINKEKIYVFDAEPHRGEFGKYTIQDQFAIGSSNIMNIYNDIFIYLPCYYHSFKLDWISEILVGFHLKYNNINIEKIPRHFNLLRYPNRNNDCIRRPTE